VKEILQSLQWGAVKNVSSAQAGRWPTNKYFCVNFKQKKSPPSLETITQWLNSAECKKSEKWHEF
jgi:hypothetical protein